jgi:hypothetical protein
MCVLCLWHIQHLCHFKPNLLATKYNCTFICVRLHSKQYRICVRGLLCKIQWLRPSKDKTLPVQQTLVDCSALLEMDT